MPVAPLESKGLTQSLADMFASVPANFDLAGRCYDLTTLDIEDLQTGDRCAQNVFLTLDAMSGTKDYKVRRPATARPSPSPSAGSKSRGSRAGGRIRRISCRAPRTS